MVDRAKKLSELSSVTSVAGDDLLIVVSDPNGTPATKSVTVSNVFNSVNVTAKYVKVATPPVLSTSDGVQGEIRFDSSYIYVCIATNTWRRSALTSW